MDSSNQQHIIKVSASTVHKISINSRKKLDEGSCSIYQQSGEYFFKLNTYTHNLRDLIFGLMNYQGSVSYFFYEQDQPGFISILSIGKDENTQDLLKQFHDTLAGYSTVKDLLTEQSSSQLVKHIKQAYSEYESKQVKSKSAFTKISKQFGSLIGAISGMVEKPVGKVGLTIEQKKQEIYETHISNDAKSKWDLVKLKASQLNQKLSESMKPVNEGVKTISSKIGHSFNHSNNAFVKTVRDISKKTKDALNEGYKQAINETENHKPLPAQSDSVMDIQVNVKNQEN